MYTLGTYAVVKLALNIGAVGGLGIGVASLMKKFHEYEFVSKKGRNKNESHSEYLRKRAKELY
ncbi:hypothetical protein [Bacillus smithii]|uniref:hypothetical protein n=1 Tax=Bacillus smithii TaxID=1479 RepID=UPI003D199C51